MRARILRAFMHSVCTPGLTQWPCFSKLLIPVTFDDDKRGCAAITGLLRARSFFLTAMVSSRSFSNASDSQMPKLNDPALTHALPRTMDLVMTNFCFFRRKLLVPRR